MLAECLVWTLWRTAAPEHARVARELQIVPSMLGASLTAGLCWLLATLVLGRVYCAGFCPAGTLQDVVIRLRRHIGPRLGMKSLCFRYRPATRTRYWILGAYIIGVVLAVGSLPLLMEPWSFFVNITGSISRGMQHPSLAYLGVGVALGFACAAISFVTLVAVALLRGRDFCNELCPIGAALSVLSARSVMHIELLPDRCTSCMKCEEACKVSCISVKDRIVDNRRCVRCFNCVSVCPEDAIRFQADRNGIISPLMQRRTEASS